MGIYPFDVNLTLPSDASKEPQIIFHRDFHCTNTGNACPCWYWCNFWAYDCCFGRQVLEVMSGEDQVLGRVKEEPEAWFGLSYFGFYNEQDECKFVCTITVSEICKLCCCGDMTFNCTRYGEEEVIATITRKCLCTAVNVATDKDHFEIHYKPEAQLDARDKFELMSIVLMVKYVQFGIGLTTVVYSCILGCALGYFFPLPLG